MKISNIHKRIINQAQSELNPIIKTLATKEDKVWPTKDWPRMKLDQGLQAGSKGGHGPISYVVQKYIPNELIQFRFTAPKNFVGIHQFEIESLNSNQTQITHTIDMDAKGTGILTWTIGVRWLHDALIEDAFDQIENQFSTEKKQSQWNLWVKTLRFFLK
jgi:hypothetical protein